MRDLYDAVSGLLAEGDEEEGIAPIEVTAKQLEDAISGTRAGDPSDSFWEAWDREARRIADFYRSVMDEPEIKRRIESGGL